MNDAKRELARCSDFDVGIEDHGMFFLYGQFTGDGWGQGFGHVPDPTFIKKFLGVFRKARLQSIEGLACWITHTHDRILLVEPLFPSEGTPFDVKQWSDNLKEEASIQ